MPTGQTSFGLKQALAKPFIALLLLIAFTAAFIVLLACRFEYFSTVFEIRTFLAYFLPI